MKPSNVLPTRESVSQHQLVSLLQIVVQLQPYIVRDAGFNLEPHHTPPEIDGGAACAAATTFIKTCGRIDELLEDRSRWGLENHDTMSKAVLLLAEQQEKFLSEQILSAKEVRRPSFQLRPTLVIVEGEFVAFYGDPLTPGGFIAGRGPTPAAALNDFDAAFLRTTPEQVQLIAEQSAEQPQPKKKRNK